MGATRRTLLVGVGTAVPYGCTLGAVPALLGVGIGAGVRWLLRMARAARWTPDARRRMAITVAGVAWGVFVVSAILIFALAVPASAAPLPWTYPVLPATLMLAAGSTALIPLSANPSVNARNRRPAVSHRRTGMPADRRR